MAWICVFRISVPSITHNVGDWDIERIHHLLHSLVARNILLIVLRLGRPNQDGQQAKD